MGDGQRTSRPPYQRFAGEHAYKISAGASAETAAELRKKLRYGDFDATPEVGFDIWVGDRMVKGPLAFEPLNIGIDVTEGIENPIEFYSRHPAPVRGVARSAAAHGPILRAAAGLEAH